MKKISLKLLFLLVLLIPFGVQAEDGIENFFVQATVERDGDVTVEEYFYLNGEFNGMDREILFKNDDLYEFRPELDYYGGSAIHNGSGLKIEEVRALPIDENFDFQNIDGTLFRNVSSAEAGDYGVYTISSSLDGSTVRIFLPDDENEAFYIKYTLKNMAVVHEDVAELFWNVIGSDLRESIGTLKVQITFPNNQNEFRVWAHGPLNGVVHKSGLDTLTAEVHNVRAYTAVDVRAVFDKDVVPYSFKKTNVVALPKILNYEEDKANQANYEREQQEYQNTANAYNQIAYCEERDQTRDCYEKAKDIVLLVIDEATQQDLEARLEDLLLLVINQEEKEARMFTNDAVQFRSYSWYKKALDAVMILENKTLQNELLAELEPVRAELVRVEETANRRNMELMALITVALLGLGFFVYYTFHKKNKANFPHKYMRDFPSSCSPSTVEYLFKRSLTDNAMTSEILYLAYQKKITIKQNDKKTDVILEKNPMFKTDANPKEAAIVKFLFNGAPSVSLQELKARVSRSLDAAKKWQTAQEKMLEEALQEEFYESDTKKTMKVAKMAHPYFPIFLFVAMVILYFLNVSSIFIMVLMIVSLALFLNKSTLTVVAQVKRTKDHSLKTFARFFSYVAIIIAAFRIIQILAQNHFIFTGIYFYIAQIILALILIIYLQTLKERTEKGALEYAKWKAFKNFLMDFGRLDEKELPEASLWGKYLVYACVLGCADVVSEAMKMRIKEFQDPPMFDPFIYNDFAFVSSSIRHSMRSARMSNHIPSSGSSGFGSSSGGSSWSSGLGGGGGFSSGGGSGGGGGGGGRF